MVSTKSDQFAPFACDMSAMAPAERHEHIATLKAVFVAVQEIREHDDGYAFRLPNEEEMVMQVAAFLAKERLCCPFFGFRMEIEPEGGSLWLTLMGREGVKTFIKAEIREALPKGVAQMW